MKDLGMMNDWLRPFVDSMAWDYCVIWKLGDDPSRFILWVGCCCSGGVDVNNIKVEKEQEDEEHRLGAICRDEHTRHPIRTKACEALSQFPLSMPLYSGIHGEVVMSNVPRWLLNHDSSGFNSKLPNEKGTRVFIPVLDGLVELFTLKTIPPDWKMVDLVISNWSPQLILDSMAGKSKRNLTVPLSRAHRYRVSNSATQSNSTSVNISFDGSSSASNPSNENPSPIQNPGSFFENFPLKPPSSCVNSCVSKRPSCTEVPLNHEQAALVMDYINKDVFGRESVNKTNRKPGAKTGHSKNLVTERNRRNRINHGIFTLRSLVPKISKMDKASTLSDAINYIIELEQEVKQLQDELKEMDELENKENVAEEDSVIPSATHHLSTPANDLNHTSTRLNQTEKVEMNLEVNQISTRLFLIRILCGYKRNAFERLMEATESLGLEIVEVNVTTLNSTVLNVLNVKVNKDGIEAETLRDLLMVSIDNPEGGENEKEERNSPKRSFPFECLLKVGVLKV